MGVRERRERERHEMQRAILEAAHDIAIREGWEAVTIRRVAEKIEYSPPTIYEYFESKEQIVVELLRDGFRLLLEDMRAARDAHADPEAALLAMGLAYWDFAWKHPALYQGMNGLGLEGSDLCCVSSPAWPHGPHGRGHHVRGDRGPHDGRGGSVPGADSPNEHDHEAGRGAPAGPDPCDRERHVEAHRQLYRSRQPDLTSEPFPEGAEIFLTVRNALERALGTGDDLERVSWKVVVLWSTIYGLITLVMRGLIPDGHDLGPALIRQTVRDLLTVWRAPEAG
jgi:AcrR family transcriptional regulator